MYGEFRVDFRGARGFGINFFCFFALDELVWFSWGFCFFVALGLTLSPKLLNRVYANYGQRRFLLLKPYKPKTLPKTLLASSSHSRHLQNMSENELRGLARATSVVLHVYVRRLQSALADNAGKRDDVRQLHTASSTSLPAGMGARESGYGLGPGIRRLLQTKGLTKKPQILSRRF